jgi:hypothetical protein
MAAGSIVVTTSDVGSGYTKYSVAWTSDAIGNVSGNSFSVRRGRIANAKYIPGSGGAAPTDLYDMTMVDGDGADVLVGGGANLSATVPTISIPNVIVEAGSLTPTIANAGNAASGTVVLYIGP